MYAYTINSCTLISANPRPNYWFFLGLNVLRKKLLTTDSETSLLMAVFGEWLTTVRLKEPPFLAMGAGFSIEE